MGREPTPAWLMDMEGVPVTGWTPPVLTGVRIEPEVDRFSYRPSRVVAPVADLVDELG